MHPFTTRVLMLSLLLPAAFAGRLVADKSTHVYKTVGDLEIKADIYGSRPGKLRPVVVWIHGGALIMGHRDSVSPRVKEFCRRGGYVLVSIDYRLAPETKLPEIQKDVEDAITWVREVGPDRFGANPNRLVIMGGSAGGYLTLSTGFRVKPAPTGLVAFWGYGDLLGAWYNQPSPHPRHHRLKLTKAEAWALVDGPAVSDSRDRGHSASGFYQYCRQTGSWPSAVSDWSPRHEADRFQAYLPVANVNWNYPPTCLVHGTKDTDVPYSESARMVEQFRKHGVRHEMLTVRGGEHGLQGADPSAIEAAYRDAFAFADRLLNPNDPFGGSSENDDPFDSRSDSTDPFGDASASSSADPFSPAQQQASAAAAQDPFSAPRTEPAEADRSRNARDPFGDPPAGAADPFGDSADNARTPPASGTMRVVEISSFSDLEREILAALALPVTFDYLDTPLDELLADIRIRYEIPIAIDVRALNGADTSASRPITIQLEHATLRSALNLMLGEFDLGYMVNDDLLTVTTAEQAKSRRLTRVYRVDEIGIGNSVESLVRLLSALTEDEDAVIGNFENRLVVKHTFRGHQQVIDLLAALER